MGILLAVNCGKCCCGSRDGKLVETDIQLQPDVTPCQVQATTDEEAFEATKIETEIDGMYEFSNTKMIYPKEVKQATTD